jgi:V/A-type H+-transporting ATPase subunit E
MSETDQVAGLETALLERADKLAAEYRINGRQQHDHMVEEARERLREEEARATLVAVAQAERAYQQQVQAAELQMRAELDRLRLELVEAVLARLPAQLEQLAADDARYLPLLHAWIADGAELIERDELVVQLNARDLQRLQKDWDKQANTAAPKKHLTLASEPLAASGGVMVVSADCNIRVDNTFEGRRERLFELLQNVVANELVTPISTGGS